MQIASENAKTNVAKRTTARTVAWCYTLNNPKAPIPWNEYQMQYHVYGEERGEQGTFHYQGFIIFKNSKLFNAVKELCPDAHWEATRATYLQAADYCKKDGVFKEFGTLPEQPQKKGAAATRDKWRFISDSAKKGDLAAIDADHPKQFVNSYRNLVAIRKDFTERLPDLSGVCGLWYHGKPGVGKTRLTSLKYPNAYLKRMNKWFDGYNGEKTIVLDDLGLDHAFMGYELKKLADRYCYMVEVKNASMYIRPERCVVTSQYTIEQVWKEDKETCAALQRRFVQVEVTPDNIELAFAIANERLAAKNNLPAVGSTPSVPDDKMLEVHEITAEEFDSVMEKYNAKPATDEQIEKLPKKLQPPNKYFPERPIRFAPYKKKFLTPRLLPPKLRRKNAIIIEEEKDEKKMEEESEEDTPTLHELYDLEAVEEILSSDSDHPSDTDDSE